MKPFEVKILEPEGPVFSGSVKGIKLPGTEGNFEVLHNHASLMSALEVGIITIKNDSTTDEYSISNGFVEVHNNRVTVIVESAEHKDDIDLDRALAAKKRAEERLAAARENKIDIARAEASLKRAINRIKLAQN